MKRIITILVIQSALLTGSDDSKKFYSGHKAVNRAGELGNKLLDRVNEELPVTMGKAGDEFGKHVVKGGIGEIRNQGNAGKEYVLAAGAAILATPYAPYVLAAVGGIMAIGTTSKLTTDYKDWRFRRCLNKHFAEDLNDRGFPQRCESPERRLSWWDSEVSTRSIEHFRAQRRLTQKILKGSTQQS